MNEWMLYGLECITLTHIFNEGADQVIIHVCSFKEYKQECATLQSKNWLIQNEKWGKAEFCLILETSTLFILGDPLEVVRGDPTDCGRPEAASRGQNSSQCRIKSGSLGSTANHSLDTGLSVQRHSKCKAPAWSFELTTGHTCPLV